MKKLFLTLTFVSFVLTSFAQMHLDIDGTESTLDTIASYQVGPGTCYTHYQLTKGNKVRNLFLLDIDLTNPYNKVENVAAYNSLGRTETLANMHKRLTSENHQMLAGVNCNFWCVSATVDAAPVQYQGLLGHPLQGTATDGVMITEPTNWNRGRKGGPAETEIGYLIIDKDKKAAVDDYAFDGKVKLAESEYPIQEINRCRVTEDENQITLYNFYAYNTGNSQHVTRAGACTEVVFKLAKWSINEDIECEVTSINNDGGTTINSETMGTLQGFGSGATFLNNFKVGDKFTINLGMYSRGHLTRPLVDQMVSGNAFVLDADTLTWRNWGEDYNYRDYPRPLLATNEAGNRLFFLVAQKPGLYTLEMCYILKHLGAYAATSMDGGGSAQMNIFGENMFATTEANPRGVANAIWAVSTAPEDNTADSVAFVDNMKTTVSSYATYQPKIRAYNKYGVLISSDYDDFTLTCEPASLGTISEDGKSFIAASTPGEGKLFVHSGDAVAAKAVEVKAGTVHINLDSVIVDKRGYAIEVFSTAEGNNYSVNPASVTWTIDDENVAAINEGVLSGVQTGTTMIHGVLDGISDELFVNVEIPEKPAMDFAALTIDTTYQVISARAGEISIENAVRCFGCPDSIAITITNDAAIKSATFSIRFHGITEPLTMQTTDAVEANTQHTYTINLAEFDGFTYPNAFPVIVEKVKFMLSKAKTNTDYHLSVNKVVVYYPNSKSTGLETLKNDDKPVQMVYQNGQIFIIKEDHMYNLNGQIIK